MKFSLEQLLDERRVDPAFFCLESGLTWQELASRADHLKTVLQNETPGFTGLLATNGVPFVTLLMAAFYAELPLVLFSPRSTMADLQKQCSALGVTRLFVTEDLCRNINGLDAGIETLLLREHDASATGMMPHHPGTPSKNIRDSSPGAALFQFTSGSTGKPKVAVRSRKSLAAEVEACRTVFNYQTFDIIWSPAPFFHAYGLVDGLLCGMAAGASFRFASQPFTRLGYAALETMDATVVVATPPFWRGLLAHDTERKLLPALRQGLTAGAALDFELAAMFRARFGFPLTNVYGMTELGTVLVSRPDDPPGMECLGFPLPGYQARLFPVNDMNELGIRKPVDDLEFLNAVDQELHVRDGHYLTGDCAVLDDDGRVRLNGRISDFINVGGEKVSPEDVIEPLRSQSDILEAVSFGIPSSWFGQTVGLYVQIATGSALTRQKIQILLSSELPTHMQPTRILISNRPIPRTPTGKILRGVLLDWLEEERDEGRGAKDPE